MNGEIQLGIITAILVPVLLFVWRLSAMVKKTYEMHHDPDEHGFGTETTNTLLLQHMKEETDMHQESIASTKELRHTIRELSHYVRWAAKERTGKTPPPYVRNGTDV